MIGYLIIDIISYVYLSLDNIISFMIYIVLAFVFIIDAGLYTIDWYMYAIKLRKSRNEPIQYRLECIACIFLNIGSYFYFIGALLSFNKTQYFEKTLLFTLIGQISFLIESFLTLFGWMLINRRKTSFSPRRLIQVTTISSNSFLLSLYFRIFLSGHIFSIYLLTLFIYLL